MSKYWSKYSWKRDNVACVAIWYSKLLGTHALSFYCDLSVSEISMDAITKNMN